MRCPWPTTPLAAEVELRITRLMPPLDPALDAEVEHHWQRACADRRLFNGRVFSADHIAPGRIDGHWTEYRRVIAQAADHALVPRVGVRSLAACGLILGPDGAPIGRRDRASAYQPGEWQFPPAGSVDQASATPAGADWRHALLKELAEEMGMSATDVAAIRPLCLIHHPSGVLDLGALIGTPLTAPELHARHAAAPDQEYDRLLVLPPAAIPAHIAALAEPLVPSVLALLAAAGLALPDR